MKVLFITHCTCMAGANRSMLQLMVELRNDYDVNPFVLLPYDNSDSRTLKHYLEDENIEFIEIAIPYFKTACMTREYRLDFVHHFREFYKLSERLKGMDFDLIHSNSSVIDFGGYLSRWLGIKHIWHLRDFGDLDYSLYSIWGKAYEKATYTNGDAYIAISDAVKKHFEKIITSKKIHTIYNGICPKDNVPQAVHTTEIVQFLCAGVICEAKNQMEIVKAVDILVNKRKMTKFHLTIVGIGGGQYLDDMKTFANSRKIENYITFAEPVDGIEQLASTMDVGIMSSHCEAFGRVTVEYMLQNLAVIANDEGANKEIVNNEITGLIYPHGSTVALADNMERLIKDRTLLSTLGKNGREDALKRFLSSKNTKAIYDLYVEELGKAKSFSVSNKLFLSKGIMDMLHIKDVLMEFGRTVI